MASGLQLLEHVNINIPSHPFANAFYGKVLGCAIDPYRDEEHAKGSGVLWYNAGATQVHLPPDNVAQRWRGIIGYAGTADAIAAVMKRAQSNEITAELAGSEFKVLPVDDPSVSPLLPAKMAASCQGVLQGPHGNRFALIVSTDGKDSRGMQQRGEQATLDGIAFASYVCPRGKASDVAYFYTTVFGANTTVQNGCCYVQFTSDDGSCRQQLIFVEVDLDAIPAYDGHHYALYVRDHTVFHDSFDKLDDRGLIFVNPRFADKVTTRAAADELAQYRLLDIVDREGQVIVQLEHEIRSPLHASNPFKSSLEPAPSK
eukprot:TRINITY_DN3701_c0_g1_i1.p1 TRINITY_DN3701_c0_g1~~TRINITY_DN3701_c0_g1_i1.p1  ORF type:complete len:315 (+),score=97.56 TRINITY_DN3701_c0_g1_i1:12-956(+)